jgi:hypothetical protein
MKLLVAPILIQATLACNYYSFYAESNTNLCYGQQCYAKSDTCTSGCCTGGYCKSSTKACHSSTTLEAFGFIFAFLVIGAFLLAVLWFRAKKANEMKAIREKALLA